MYFCVILLGFFDLFGICALVRVFCKNVKAMERVPLYEIEGNKGKKRTWIDRFLEASDVVEEVEE